MYEEVFQVKSNNIDPHKGRILIASPLLYDYHFSRSVVLIINKDENGTMGIVLNKDFRYHILLSDLIKDVENMPNIPVGKGGPIGRNALFFVHDIEGIEDAMDLGNGLYVNGDLEQIVKMMNNGEISDNRIRFYLGYSGWTEEQLDKEIGEDSWIISELDKEYFFNNEFNGLWRYSLEEMGEPYRTWSAYPIFPSMN